MAEADEDGNEEIEFEEFCLLLLKKRTEVQALGELREAFNVRSPAGAWSLGAGPGHLTVHST